MDEKLGRNDLCPCGSGKKYKKCCFGKPPKPKFSAKVIRSGGQPVQETAAQNDLMQRFMQVHQAKVNAPFEMTQKNFRVDSKNEEIREKNEDEN